MKQVIELIKQAISECEKNGDMFKMPSLNRPDVEETRTDLGSHGSVLYSEEYRFDFENEDWIIIHYESKDKMRTFQVNPDRSVISVTCSDSSLNFSYAWDEGLFGRSY